MQYAAYKHEAISRGLPYITLPTQINLGDSDFLIIIKRLHILLQAI